MPHLHLPYLFVLALLLKIKALHLGLPLLPIQIRHSTIIQHQSQASYLIAYVWLVVPFYSLQLQVVQLAVFITIHHFVAGPIVVSLVVLLGLSLAKKHFTLFDATNEFVEFFHLFCFEFFVVDFVLEHVKLIIQLEPIFL